MIDNSLWFSIQGLYWIIFCHKFVYFTEVQGSLYKFPDFFRMGTFIDSTHMKL